MFTMSTIRPLITILIILFTGSGLLAGVAEFPGKKHLRRWSIADGLPHNSVFTAFQSRSGYIWLGTASGLCRFDGWRFQIFSDANSPLQNEHITILSEEYDGTLWVGTDAGGVHVLRDSEWISYDRRNGLSHNQVQAIVHDWQGFTWVGTSYGLNRIGPEKIQTFTRKDGLPDDIITALTIDHAGRVWIGSLRGGLSYFDGEIFQAFGYRAGLTVSAITNLFTDAQGMIWIGSQEGLFVLDPTDQLIRYISGTDYTPVTCITESPDHSIWFATMSDGIKQVQRDSCISYTPDNGFPDEYVHTLFFDREASLWIGTDSQGLLQWLHTPVSMINLADKVVTAVLSDGKDSVWVGTRSGGLYRLVSNQVHHKYDHENGLPGVMIKALYQDREKHLWIVTEDAGLIRKQNSRFLSVVTPEDLASPVINVITQNNTGEFWIGTDRGLYRLSDGLLSAPFLKNLRIQVLTISDAGDLIAGTSSGVWRAENFPDPDFIQIDPTREIDVSSLFMCPGGLVLIGSHNHGLYVLRNDSIIHLSVRNGLPDDHILSITCDDTGNIWIGSYKGIFCIPKEEIAGIIAGKSLSVKTIWFDESDGMTSRQCTAEASPGIARLANGMLYFATTNGIAAVTQESDINASINAIIKDKLNLIEEKSGRVVIDVTAFDYLAPDKVHFRYKLDNEDFHFNHILPGQERRIVYTDLAPGDHSLIVQASGNYSNWQDPPLRLLFYIPSPWYLNPASFAATASLFTIILLVVRVFRKHQQRLRLQNKYRTLSIDPDRTAGLIKKLTMVLQQEQPYLDPDLTIGVLARKLKIHTNHLSRIINQQFGLSFNDFINRMRIDIVKQRLKDPANQHKTILEIMYDSGFHSKSVFNTAFKKFTGMTPKDFRQS